jgi:hypothetical protein
VHATLLLEEEDLAQVQLGAGDAHLGRAQGPGVQWAQALEAPVRVLVILSLDPGPESAVEGVQGRGVLLAEGGQQLHPDRAKPPFLLAFSGWLVGPGVDEGDAELGADRDRWER